MINKELKLKIFSINFGTFKFEIWSVIKDKKIDVHICRKFVCVNIWEYARFKFKLLCVFNAYPAICYA